MVGYMLPWSQQDVKLINLWIGRDVDNESTRHGGLGVDLSPSGQLRTCR